MIISIMRGDINFVPNPKDYVVKLNGVVQSQCITADDEKGTILRYSVNKYGLRRKKGSRFETETINGEVTISLKEFK